MSLLSLLDRITSTGARCEILLQMSIHSMVHEYIRLRVVTTVSPAKTTEVIKIHVGLRNNVLDGCTYGCHTANIIEQSMLGVW